MNDNKQFDVLCAGAATWDTLLTGIDRDLMDTDSLLAEDCFAAAGGDAVNAAVSMAKLGMKTSISCVLGNDSPARLVMEELRRNGICTDDIHILEHAHTSSPVLLIDEMGERHIIRVPNSGNHFFTEDMISDEVLEKASHLHFASVNVLKRMDGKPLGRLFERAHAKGLTTSLDASYDKATRGLEPVESALWNCDIFFPSMQEARIYAGSDDIDEISAFFEQFPLKIFGIKLGEKGVFVRDEKEKIFLDTLYHKTPVDTTGAGDAFLAGFTAAWLKGYDLKSCALCGSAQSASVLDAIGANTGAGTWTEAMNLIHAAGYEMQKR